MSRLHSSRPLAKLLAWEAVTNLGESAAETSLLLRAGISNVQASHFIDDTGQRVLLCAAPSLPPNLPANERMSLMAAHCLATVWERFEACNSDRDESLQPILLLALPERFAVSETHYELTVQGQAFVVDLQKRLSPGLAGSTIEPFPFGRAAGALAMRRALQLIGTNRVVLWGGVDSLHDWPVLEALQRADRLITAENIDGLRPGEGAAFVVMGLADGSDGSEEVELIALGLGREPHPIGSETPSLAIGLTQALDAALLPLRAEKQRTGTWMLDLTHEAYSTQALQNIIARFSDVLEPQTELQMPLKALGDVGAAAIPLLTVLSAEAWRLGHASDDIAVVTGCSDNGARGALVLAEHCSSRSIPSRVETE